MVSTASSPAVASDRVIENTRVVPAPRSFVWRAWTDPEILAQWWGPKSFRNTFEEFDPRPGGHWRFVMHGPDGTDYRNHSIFVKLAGPGRIVLDHVTNPKFQVTATFDDLGAKTRITFRMQFETAALCAKVKPYVMPANEENFDRIEAELAKMS